MCKLINSLVTLGWIVDGLNHMKLIRQPGVAIFIGDRQILEPDDYKLLHQRFSSFRIQDQIAPQTEAVNVIFTNDINILRNLTRMQGFFTRSRSYIYVTVFGKTEIDPFLREVWNRFNVPRSFGINCNTADFYSYDASLKTTQAQAVDELNTNILRHSNKPVLKMAGSFSVVYFERESFVVDDGLKVIGGQDALAMKTLAEHFNTKVELVETSDGRRYGQRGPNGTTQGAFTNLLEGTAEITGNTHFLKYYGIPGLDFTHYMGVDRLCLLVPKAKKIPIHVALYQKVHYRWLFIYITLCISGLAFTRGTEKLLKMGHGMNKSVMISVVFRISLGVPILYRFDKIHEKIVVSSFLLATVVISNYFQGVMTTIASRPWYEKPMNTLEQVRENGVPIIYSSSEVKSYLFNDDLHGMNFIEVTVEESKAATNSDIGRTHRTFSVFAKKNMYYKGLKASKSLQIVPECLVDYPLAFVVPVCSPLLQPINSVLSKLVESGLYLKWTRDSVSPDTYTEKDGWKEQKSSAPEAVTNQEIYFAYAILGVGQAISLVIFLAEHVAHIRKPQTKDDVSFADRFRFVH